MSTRQLRIGDIGGLGIFSLLADGLALPLRDNNVNPREESGASKRGLADRIDDWFWRRHQRSVEMRLAQAEDVFQLERMIRALERGDIKLHR